MASLVQPSMIAQVLRLLPGPLLRALDGWSQRVALRRREERQRRWAQRKAAAQAKSELPFRSSILGE
jgi:hypothetical protein